MGKQCKQWQTLFSWAPKSQQMLTAAMKLKDSCSLKDSYDKPRQHIKSRDIALPTKVHLVKAMIFPLVMYGCESWTIKKSEHRRIAAFELWCWRRLWRVPWTAGRSKNSKGNQSWIFIGRTDVEAETPKLWAPDAKNWLIGKDPDAGKDWMQKEKGMKEDEMVGWHHCLSGHEFEQTPGDSNGHGSLVCCSPSGCKELDMTEWLKWLTERMFWYFILNCEYFRLDLKNTLQVH